MAFFKQFPTQSYDFNMDGVLQNVVDIYRSVRVEGSSMDNAATYNNVQIRNGERPDRMSYRLYGTSDYYWTFFIINDHLHDGMSVWPMSQEDLHEYLNIEFSGYAISTFPRTSFNTDLGLRSFQNSIVNQFELNEQVLGSQSGARATVVKRDLDLNQIIVKQNTALNANDNTIAFLGDGDNVTENVDGQRTGHSVASHRVWPYREAPHHYYKTGDEQQRPITLSEAFTTSDGQLPLDLTPMSSTSYVSNQAYMEELNSERSRIRVIAPKYIEQFAEDFEELINE